jgi:hypothetical protein
MPGRQPSCGRDKIQYVRLPAGFGYLYQDRTGAEDRKEDEGKKKKKTRRINKQINTQRKEMHACISHITP